MRHTEELDRVVVAKVGSSTLVGADGALDYAYLTSLVDQLVQLKAMGYRPVLVSSGAVAAGMERLGLKERPSDIPALQACASAGQAALTEAYAERLAAHGCPCGQVLLTRRDVIDRRGYLNARNTLDYLLELGAVPVVNENDTVAAYEFVFGDNDMLGAIVSTLVGAERYVILSDIDGMYTADPATHPDAELIEHVDRIDRGIEVMAGGAGSSVGTGGMEAKLRAARALLAAGIPMTICHGRRPGALVDAVLGKGRRTEFGVPGAPREQARKLWIGIANCAAGTVEVDQGCADAIRNQGASLLPVGVRSVSGSFDEGDVVSVVGPDGSLIARGVARYDAADLSRARGLPLDVVARFLPAKADVPAIHRDELLVF